MDIRKARKIAERLDFFEVSSFQDEDLRNAFHRLDRSGLQGNKNDFTLAKKIWTYYGNKDRNKDNGIL